MAAKTYNVMNMSFRDVSRKDDYLLTTDRVPQEFKLPLGIGEFQYMFPSEFIRQICEESITDMTDMQYTAEQIDEMINVMTLEFEEKIENAYEYGTDFDSATDNVQNNDKLVLNVLSTE